MQANLYGTPEDVMRMSSSLLLGQSVAAAIGGFLDKADPRALEALGALAAGVGEIAGAVAQRIGENGAGSAHPEQARRRVSRTRPERARAQQACCRPRSRAGSFDIGALVRFNPIDVNYRGVLAVTSIVQSELSPYRRLHERRMRPWRLLGPAAWPLEEWREIRRCRARRPPQCREVSQVIVQRVTW
jgi:hypothetical protein